MEVRTVIVSLLLTCVCVSVCESHVGNRSSELSLKSGGHSLVLFGILVNNRWTRPVPQTPQGEYHKSKM